MSLSQPLDKPDNYCRLEVISRIERRFGNNVLVVEKSGPGYDYRRFEADECVVKNTIASAGALEMGILPVAPVHVPARYGSNMMLKFANPLVMQSHSSLDAYFKMPYEIGAVSFDNGRASVIDAISLGLAKYGLYGNPEDGSVCRSYRTELYAENPEPKMHQEAVGSVRLRNETDTTQTVNKLVFPVAGVDFYYDRDRVFFKDVEATIKEVAKKTIVETKVVDARWRGSSTGLAQQSESHYSMEWGF
jgi:hypothetical protein